MEIIVAIISGVVLGCVIGFFFSKVKNQDGRSLVEKLQWQLENDKLNAAQQIANLQQQMEVQKVEAKENLEVAKQEAEVRIAQVKAEAERQTKAALEAQEVRYTQTLQSQKQQMAEAMTLVEAKAKEMQEAQELRHRQEIVGLDSLNEAKVAIGNNGMLQIVVNTDQGREPYQQQRYFCRGGDGTAPGIGEIE